MEEEEIIYTVPLKDFFQSEFERMEASFLTHRHSGLDGSLRINALAVPDTKSNNSLHLDADGNLWLGNVAFASALFRVSSAGAIKSTSGEIGGFTITSTQLSATNFLMVSGAANTARVEVGTGSTIAGINSPNASGDIAFWAGATFANRATAPYRVNAGGDITARSISSVFGSNLLQLDQYTAGEAINAATTPQAVYQDASNGKVLKTDADDTTKRRFFGFVDNAQNISADATCEVVTQGIVSGFSGLTAGDYVYLTDTAGAISHTASTTMVIRVGIAVSASEVLLDSFTSKVLYFTDNPARRNSNLTNTITVGFKPKVIMGIAYVEKTSDAVTYYTTYTSFICDGTASQSYWGSDNGGGGIQVGWGSGFIAEPKGTAYTASMSINIQNITTTGFDLLYTYTTGGGAYNVTGGVRAVVLG